MTEDELKSKSEARQAFYEQRRKDLIDAGELPEHEQDKPAGEGTPVEQPQSEGMKIDGKGKRK